MTTRQGKLAAARRRLREFQGKNKELEILKEKSTDVTTPKISVVSTTDNSPDVKELENSQNNHLITQPNYAVQQFIEKSTENDLIKNKASSSTKESNLSITTESEYHKPTEILNKIPGGSPSDCANGLNIDCIELSDIDRKKSVDIKTCPSTVSTACDMVMLKEKRDNLGNAMPFCDGIKVKSIGAQDFFDQDISSKNALNNIIKPLQTELQNHAQTIKILVQQRNDAQSALTTTQQLLNEKSGEAEELKHQLAHLNSSTQNLSQRLLDAENVIMKLKLEKEENLLKQEKIQLLADEFQVQLDAKEEEFQELERKYEEKNINFQKLLLSLHEAQSQLSLHQIQLQQYSPEGNSSLAVQISELQNMNQSLKQKIAELEKKLEAEGAEKEESSQKFHTYAQQCNSQLSSLNSQIKSLKSENEALSQNNMVLTRSLFELENMKEKEKTSSSKSFENEIADLHHQLSALSEKSNQLDCDLRKKNEECSLLDRELNKKDLEINQLLMEIKDLKEEYKNLASEAESSTANERLLATMESDKIAAAKAVSQNQKLKEQVVELEKAFIKLSEEKLELTNELAHEKHVNAKLQLILKGDEYKHHLDEDHDSHSHKCHHGAYKTEPLLNDSNEIEELRNIIRQLQDDKMELTARLNSYESNRSILEDNSKKNKKQKPEDKDEAENGNGDGDKQSQNTKLLLQKMEEKVRKTMNEIALLDEEKEKLEHLVLQLQGETETIGEYITLYQKQRMLLRQRAQEKDVQLMQLSKDKEELKSKLIALDELVQHLIVEKESVNIQSESKLTTNSSNKIPENTAGKIRALINEIGSTTLINNHSIAFEHCSCCSGRLITI